MRRNFYQTMLGLLVAIAIRSPALSAQSPASVPPIANPIITTIRGFGFYGSYLMMAFDSIPAGKYDFKPSPLQQSVGTIAQHLETANYKLCEILGGTLHKWTAKDSLADSVKAAWPKDTLTARLKASFLFCQAAVSKLDDKSLAENLTVGTGPTARTAPRVRWLILFITDIAEHYSQVASYMRIMGMVPPSALPAVTPPRD